MLVGGGAADVADVVDRVRADFPRTALFIIVSTYLVLFVLLRSVVLPAKALVMNTLSIVASFGALVWIFQDGNLSAPLGFQPLGFVETTQPVILFCVLFGLSMDYEVFLLSRMKEVWDRTHDNIEAVARGMERSGRIVTSAALIVVVVAGSFAFADIVLIKALGIGMAIAVALDATVVRALLVPATMRLLGRWNWWMPASLERFMARPPAGPRGRRGGGDPMTTAHATVGAACWPRGSPWRSSWSGCTGGGAPILANPTAASAVARRRPTPPPVAVADPTPVVLPRDDGPHDRLTEWWYYTGHLRAADGRRFGFEFVIFRAERGRVPDLVGLAPRDHRRDGRPVPVQPAPRGRAAGGPLAARRRRPADRVRPGPVRRRPDATGDRRSAGVAMTGGDGTRPAGRRARAGRGCGGRHARPGSAWICDSRRPSRPPSTTAMAGSTSGRRAGRTTTRGRR